MDAISRTIQAPRGVIYRALLDPRAIERWRAPEGMRVTVHAFDAREGGRFRVSLTYDDPSAPGKSGGHTDTYRGHFARLSLDEEVVEVVEFEAADPRLRGPMTVTTTLRDAGDGTEVTIAFEDLPPGVAPADNRVGTEMALGKLAGLLETPG
jgi:uncharacterized protein YndB with AHSA1/START domain